MSSQSQSRSKSSLDSLFPPWEECPPDSLANQTKTENGIATSFCTPNDIPCLDNTLTQPLNIISDQEGENDIEAERADTTSTDTDPAAATTTTAATSRTTSVAVEMTTAIGSDVTIN